MEQESYWSKKRAQALFEQALELEKEGKITQAAELYLRSAANYPQDGQIQYNLGIALAAAGKIEQAIRAWKRAIWLCSSFKQELEKAFDFDADLVEDLIPLPFISSKAENPSAKYK